MYFILWITQEFFHWFNSVSFSPKIAAKQAAAAATQTIAASQNAAVSNKNTAAHQQLVQSCKVNISQPTDNNSWTLLYGELKITFYNNTVATSKEDLKRKPQPKPPPHAFICMDSGEPSFIVLSIVSMHYCVESFDKRSYALACYKYPCKHLSRKDGQAYIPQLVSVE